LESLALVRRGLDPQFAGARQNALCERQDGSGALPPIASAEGDGATECEFMVVLL
jgi:hypothetical protein